MSKFVYYLLFLILSANSLLFSDDISNEADKIKNFSRQNQNQSIIKSGMSIIDAVFQKIEKNILNYVPVIAGYNLIEGNTYYTASDNNGIIEFYIQADKIISNKTTLLKITFDNSLNNVERFSSLMKSFDYLMDKGGYRKINITVDGGSNFCLENSNTVNSVFVFEEKDDAAVSGLSVSFDYNFLNNISDADKNKIIESDIHQFFDKLKLKEISSFLK